ncbi:hypothetical protein ACEXUL_001714, partial [Campylobacter jejuni]
RLIIAARADGFGERMLAFLNAIYISKTCGLEFKYIWLDFSEKSKNDKGILMSQANLASECHIFSKSFIKKNSYNSKINFIPTDGLGLFLRHKKYYLKKILTYPPSSKLGYLSTQYDLSKICIDVDEKHYYNQIVDIWKSIDFSKEILKVQNIANTYCLNLNFNAMHIRSGDILFQERIHFLYDGREKALCLHLAIEVIRLELIKGNNIIIFTDDLKNIKNFIKHINENFTNERQGKIILMDDIVKGFNFSPVQRTFFEITVMSNANIIYASGKSGFSNLACRIRNKANIISVYKMFSTKEKYILIKKYMNILNNIHPFYKSFACLHLYLLSDKLKLNFQEQKKYLKEGLQYDPENLIFYFFYIYILCKENKIIKVENILAKLFVKQYFKEHFLAYLLNISPYNYSFMYSHVLKELLKKVNFSLPCSSYIVYRFILKMQHDKNINIHFNHINEKINIEKKIQYFKNTLFIYSEMFSGTLFFSSGAVDRIKNQLSYKIGNKIIKSKGFFDFIILPFSILLLVYRHKRFISI